MLVLINIETYAMVSPKKVIKISNNIETDDALNGVGVFIIILYIFSYEILQKVHVFYYNIFSC